MATIDTVRTTSQPGVYEVLLTKDDEYLGVPSAGILYGYSSEAQAKAHPTGDEHRRGSWTSPASTTRGRGNVPASVAGEWLVASEGHGNPPKWSDPYHVGDVT